jgi:hypothetical protein
VSTNKKSASRKSYLACIKQAQPFELRQSHLSTKPLVLHKLLVHLKRGREIFSVIFNSKLQKLLQMMMTILLLIVPLLQMTPQTVPVQDHPEDVVVVAKSIVQVPS